MPTKYPFGNNFVGKKRIELQLQNIFLPLLSFGYQLLTHFDLFCLAFVDIFAVTIENDAKKNWMCKILLFIVGILFLEVLTTLLTCEEF